MTANRVLLVRCGVQSVADSKNYGTEPSAKALLYPQPYAVRGVNEEDFLEGYAKVRRPENGPCICLVICETQTERR